jgi:hypothetical protein
MVLMLCGAALTFAMRPDRPLDEDEMAHAALSPLAGSAVSK